MGENAAGACWCQHISDAESDGNAPIQLPAPDVSTGFSRAEAQQEVCCAVNRPARGCTPASCRMCPRLKDLIMRLDFGSFVPKPAPETRGLHHLYSPEQIALVLQRERARADRHRREFSLIIFKAGGPGRPHASLLRMSKLVLNHARTTDDVGYFDVDSVCTVLPETSSTGAWRLGQRVCEEAKRHGLRPACVVYTYPTAWFPTPVEGDETVDPSHNGDRREIKDGGDPRYVSTEDTIRLTLDDAPVHELESLLMRPMPRWKRMLDIAGASAAILMFSPLMVLAAALIKFSDPGPMLFKQRRSGRGGKPFLIYKFRTMCIDAEKKKASLRASSEQDGPAFKLTHDPRVTRVGTFLRKTSLDELPQLFNVLKGEMSLVGPRPLPIDEQDAADLWHRRRLDVTPGLTCVWQVKGRSQVTFEEWMRMDINYIRKQNLSHDLSILAQTLPAVLLRKGAK